MNTCNNSTKTTAYNPCLAPSKTFCKVLHAVRVGLWMLWIGRPRTQLLQRAFDMGISENLGSYLRLHNGWMGMNRCSYILRLSFFLIIIWADPFHSKSCLQSRNPIELTAEVLEVYTGTVQRCE